MFEPESMKAVYVKVQTAGVFNLVFFRNVNKGYAEMAVLGIMCRLVKFDVRFCEMKVTKDREAWWVYFGVCAARA